MPYHPHVGNASILNQYGVVPTAQHPDQAVPHSFWPFYGYPNRFTRNDTLDGKVLKSPAKQRGRLGDAFVHRPVFSSTSGSDHGGIQLLSTPNKWGTGQVRSPS
jgi:hypothetical protein